MPKQRKVDNLATRVAARLTKGIRSGHYKPGQQLPSERELVETYQVSRVTVNRALAMLDAKGVVYRRHGIGTFVADASVSPATSCTTDGKLIKFINPGTELNGDLSARTSQERIHRQLKKKGQMLGFCIYCSEEEYIEELLALEETPGLFGSLIWHFPSLEGDKILSHLRHKGIRYVLLDNHPRDSRCDYVESDNFNGARDMVGHLAACGHRRIVYISQSFDGYSSLEDRCAGFFSGMVLNHCPFTQDSVHTVPGGDIESLKRTIQAIIDWPQRPTAIFASNDTLAFDVFAVLKNLGLCVPTDVSLAGFDDLSRSQYFEVPLTTMAQDFYEEGRVAATLLQEQPLQMDRQFFYQVKIKTTLVDRNSVARIVEKKGATR